MNPILESALKYCAKGYSVIPIGKNKKPIVKWEKYQKEKATPEEIKTWFKDFNNPNIAILTGQDANLFVVDCDSKAAIEQIESMLPENIILPITSTPRGGRHYYFSYVDEIPNRSDVLFDVDARTTGGYIVCPPSTNGNGRSYSWIGENDLLSIEPPSLPVNLLNAFKAYIKKDINTYTSINIAKDGPEKQLFQKGRRDQDIFHIANQLKIARTPLHEIEQVLEILAKNCNPPFPEKEMYLKIQSALKRAEKKERNLAEEIRQWICLQEGTINLQLIYSSLQLTTREDKKNVSIILKRLSEQENPLITKVSGVTGTYKTINQKVKIVDLADRTDLKGELPILFPLGIHELIKPMPGCVYIIAGETDSGKSAFLMNFAKKNTERFKVHYFTTEGGKEEFLDRTDHFWLDIGDDKNFILYEDCYEDFELHIQPDDINIIDYLDLFDNFYLMASAIDKIGRSLRNGIVFIALQKPQGRDEGTGGGRTKNLARLYLSLRPNHLKIAKAKNWRDAKFNPNNLEIEFKLAEGCRFFNTSPWRKV